MGFFDAMKKIVGGAQQLKSQLDAIPDTPVPKTPQPSVRPVTIPSAQAAKKTDAALLETGSIPAKPSVKRSTCAYRDDDKYVVTFQLSGDFVEFNSHCELDPSYQYEPDCNEEYTEYLEHHPEIFFGAPDTVYDTIEAYRLNGTAGKDFTRLENGTFLFKARTEYFGDVLWMYAFSEQSAMEGDAVCLQYHPDIVGTPLEQKLIAALDEAAMTYTESKIN
ncbi:MAG: hypothetical protein ACI4XB_08275 [Ruminococcus sp.]